MGDEAFSKVAQDISILYELSLAVGQSLNLTENCANFVTTLMARKNLGFVSVWIKAEVLGLFSNRSIQDDSAFLLLYARPQFRVRESSLPSTHQMFRMSDERGVFSVSSTHKCFSELITEKGIQTGTFAIFKLGDIGHLKLYSMARQTPLNEVELNQLQNVIQKFGVSLEGCIAHQKVVREVADRKRAETDWRISEEKYRQLFDEAPIGYHEIDTEGKIVRINKTEAAMFGYAQNEMVGKCVWDFMLPTQRQKSRRAVKEKLAGRRRLKPFERRFLCKDGSEIVVVIADKLITNEKGQVMGIRSTLQDITTRKRVEDDQQRLLKEVELKNQELKDFAYVVSHDLKAPLRAIGSLAEWLVADYSAKLGEEGRGQLNLLMSRVRRMHDLINGILQYSRVGRVVEEKQDVDLNQLVTDVIDIINPPANIAINIVGELPSIVCEKTRMGQVFQNLISNAVKYMDKANGLIEIGCSTANGYWQFRVADNGPGIDEKYHSKIFQIFQTLKPRDEYESTGIGLTLVKKIIETNGGSIWVESEVGQGSTFYFELPRS